MGGPLIKFMESTVVIGILTVSFIHVKFSIGYHASMNLAEAAIISKPPWSTFVVNLDLKDAAVPPINC